MWEVCEESQLVQDVALVVGPKDDSKKCLHFQQQRIDEGFLHLPIHYLRSLGQGSDGRFGALHKLTHEQLGIIEKGMPGQSLQFLHELA